MNHYNKAEALINKLGARARVAGRKPMDLVKAAEEKLGLQFPPSYRRFCLDYGAGKLGGLELFGILEKKDTKKEWARQYPDRGGIGMEGYVAKRTDRVELLDTVEKTLALRKAGFPPQVVVLRTYGTRAGFGLFVTDPTGRTEAPVVSWFWWQQPKELKDFYLVAKDFGEFLLAELENPPSMVLPPLPKPPPPVNATTGDPPKIDWSAYSLEANKNRPYKYFLKPHEFSAYQKEAQECSCCGQERSGYELSGEAEFVCERCLRGGKLEDLGSSTNVADQSLAPSIRKLNPTLGKEAAEELAARRWAELNYRTPHLQTFQEWEWPAHCGDYACFIKEAGKPDFNTLAPDRNGANFLSEHMLEGDDNWKMVRPDSPQDGSSASGVTFYLFQCLHCGEYLVVEDAD
jgi:uncharacterized protein CbrC (UPF0167 family)